MSEEFELAEAAPALRVRYGISGPVPVRPEDAELLADGSIEPAALFASLRDYVATRPEWATTFRPVIGRVAGDAGRAAVEAGDWDAGAIFASAVLDDNPGDNDARVLLVRALHGSGRYEQAADVGDVLLDEVDVVDPLVVVWTAESYERSSRVTHALRLLDRYIAADPEQSSYPEARAAIVERLALAADAGTLPEPPRLPTTREPSTEQPRRDLEVVAPVVALASVSQTPATQTSDDPPSSVSWISILAGLFIGAGVALVLLALL